MLTFALWRVVTKNAFAQYSELQVKQIKTLQVAARNATENNKQQQQQMECVLMNEIESS